jgi:nitronate monooxygenase
MSDTAPPAFDTPLTRHAHIRIPLICGPMYPCSNPELVAAVSAAGALGIVQPLALTYVHGYDFRDGLRTINRLSGGAPIGFNALIEAASKTYHNRMVKWVDIALEEGVRFFLTSLGNPRWVCDRVHAAGGVVYHDVTELKWAEKGRDGGVDGLVAVNRDAGGHTGSRDARALLDEVRALGLPVVAAGGVGEPAQFKALLDMGYAGVQLGTRFIATPECRADDAYKYAIVEAQSRDIVLTERLTGVTLGTAGIAVARGSLANVALRWNEAVDKWQVTNDGTTYSNLVASSTGLTAIIEDTAPALGGNLNTNSYTLSSNVGNLKFNGNIQINNTLVAPSAVTGATVVYAAAPNAGASGVFVVNGEAVNEELITKKRAFAFSILL